MMVYPGDIVMFYEHVMTRGLCQTRTTTMGWRPVNISSPLLILACMANMDEHGVVPFDYDVLVVCNDRVGWLLHESMNSFRVCSSLRKHTGYEQHA